MWYALHYNIVMEEASGGSNSLPLNHWANTLTTWLKVQSFSQVARGSPHDQGLSHYHIWQYQTTTYCIIPYHINNHDKRSYYTLHHNVSYIHITLSHIASYHILFISHCVIFHYIISYSYHIVSYSIIPYPIFISHCVILHHTRS